MAESPAKKPKVRHLNEYLKVREQIVESTNTLVEKLTQTNPENNQELVAYTKGQFNAAYANLKKKIEGYNELGKEEKYKGVHEDFDAYGRNATLKQARELIDSLPEKDLRGFATYRKELLAAKVASEPSPLQKFQSGLSEEAEKMSKKLAQAQLDIEKANAASIARLGNLWEGIMRSNNNNNNNNDINNDNSNRLMDFSARLNPNAQYYLDPEPAAQAATPILGTPATPPVTPPSNEEEERKKEAKKKEEEEEEKKKKEKEEEERKQREEAELTMALFSDDPVALDFNNDDEQEN
jgi:hypothetical protein